MSDKKTKGRAAMDKRNGTVTADGFIPHLRLITSAGVIHAPVKLVLDSPLYTRANNALKPDPMRRSGQIVFALPGGGEMLY